MTDWSTAINMAYTALSVIGILVAGAVWVMTIANKLSSRIIILETSASDFKQRIKTLEEAEKKNEYVRHNFKAVTEALEQHISSQIDYLKEHVSSERRNLEEKIRHLEKILELTFNGKNQ